MCVCVRRSILLQLRPTKLAVIWDAGSDHPGVPPNILLDSGLQLAACPHVACSLAQNLPCTPNLLYEISPIKRLLPSSGFNKVFTSHHEMVVKRVCVCAATGETVTPGNAQVDIQTGSYTKTNCCQYFSILVHEKCDYS